MLGNFLDGMPVTVTVCSSGIAAIDRVDPWPTRLVIKADGELTVTVNQIIGELVE